MENKDYLDLIKKIELEMLIEFIDVCNSLGLKYYLIGGTLLGAVRHNGFIPWDDDIDVGMPRPDYEKFLRFGQNFLSKHLFIQNIYTDPEYLMCFSKIRNNNTTFIESTVSHHRINHGLYIDIFPLDYYPNSFVGKINAFKAKCYSRRISLQFNNKNTQSNKKKIINLLLKIIIPSVEEAKYKREFIHKNFKSSDLIANFGGAWGKKEIMPCEWYGNGKKWVFEGIDVCIPSDYHKWLKQVYGDYMILPPISKQITHHYTEIIDLDKSYTYYLK